MRMPGSICVYCGSRFGASPDFAALAEAVGTAVARAGMTLVYGGGQVGLMGSTARAALAAGGKVVGIIPGHLDAIEVSQTGLTELHVVADMHTRKRMMFDRSDAFLVLPGGLGSLDEFFETATWAQLGLHDKPILLLDHKGYWRPLLDLVDHVIAEGFAAPESRALFRTVGSVAEVFEALGAAPEPRRESRGELI